MSNKLIIHAVGVFLALVPVASIAQEVADPTFDGLAKTLRCNVGTTALCAGDGCVIAQAGAIGPDKNAWISLEKGTIGPTSGLTAETRTIAIKEISPKNPNANMYVKFEVQNKGKLESIGLLILTPNQAGGYGIAFGNTVAFEKKAGDPMSVTQLVQGGSCEIQN